MPEITIQANPSGYPVSNVAGMFPALTRYFSDCPIDMNSVEYDDMNPFPATMDTVVYAFTLGVGDCCIPLKINIQGCTYWQSK